jgi:Mn2+/Fe2+ NRAMP family transporter
MSESLGLKEGLNKKWFQAIPFYVILILSVLIGMCINFLQIDTIKALIYSAVLNGMVAPFILAAIVILSQNKKVMGKEVNSMLTTVFGWAVVAVMCVVSVFAVTSFI